MLYSRFFFFWLRWVFVAAHGLSLVAASGGYSSCSARASHCSGFSCCRAQAVGVRASVVAAHGPQRAQASVVVARGLSSCGTQALEHRLSSCPAACGIFPDQGSNLCSLHWQADS